MTASPYAVRDYRDGDREPLRALCREAWRGRPADAFDRRWWWSRPRPPLKVAEDPAGALVGFCGFEPFTLYFSGRDYAGAWFADFFLAPGHQGKGLGRLMAGAVAEGFDLAASLNHNEAALSLFRKMGWRERGAANLYLNPWPAVPGARRWLARPRAESPYRLEIVSGLPAAAGELDSLWSRAKDRWAPAARRDAAALERRYAPLGRGYKTILCYQGAALAGYMITRVAPAGAVRSLPAKPVGLIVDFLVQPGEPSGVFRALLSRALAQLARDGAAFVLSLTTVDAFGRELARSGFLHAGTPLVGAGLSRLRARFAFAGPAAEALGPSPWYLTLGDADLDLMW